MASVDYTRSLEDHKLGEPVEGGRHADPRNSTVCRGLGSGPLAASECPGLLVVGPLAGPANGRRPRTRRGER